MGSESIFSQLTIVYGSSEQINLKVRYSVNTNITGKQTAISGHPWPERPKCRDMARVRGNATLENFFFFFFAVALRPNAGLGLLILEVSRSHTTTHHSR